MSGQSWKIALVLSTFQILLRLQVYAIMCYECNQFPNESRIPCPASTTVNYGSKFDVSLSETFDLMTLEM